MDNVQTDISGQSEFVLADTLTSRIRNLYSSFEQPERIHCRHSRADQYNHDDCGKCPVIAHHTAQKARDDQEEAAQYKRLSAQPMCPVPVFRAVQRPRDADADCVVLLELWHIVPEDDEEDANQYRNNNPYIYVHAEGDCVSNTVYDKRHYRDDPEHQREWLFVDVSPLRVIKGNEGDKQLQYGQNTGHAEYSKCFSRVSVSLSVCTPVCCNLFGQLVPYDEAEKDWQQCDQRCNDNCYFIFFYILHRLILSFQI